MFWPEKPDDISIFKKNLEEFCSHLTLHFYNNEPSKNKHFLILPSSVARYSKEPILKRIFEILWVLFEKMLVFYSGWPKFWIWQTLEHVRDIFCKCHLHNAPKEVSWPKKFEFHAWVQKCHFGNLSMHAIHISRLKDFFWGVRTKALNLSANMYQVPPNPGFRSVRVENWDFPKIMTHKIKKYFSIWVPVNT